MRVVRVPQSSLWRAAVVTHTALPRGTIETHLLIHTSTRCVFLPQRHAQTTTVATRPLFDRERFEQFAAPQLAMAQVIYLVSCPLSLHACCRRSQLCDAMRCAARGAMRDWNVHLLTPLSAFKSSVLSLSRTLAATYAPYASDQKIPAAANIR